MFWAALVVVSSQVSTPVVDPVTPLWQELTVGMRPEVAAAVIRKVDGIRSVAVKTSKKGKASLSIEYTETGISFVGIRQTISTVFDGGALQSVTLSGQACATLAAAKFKELQTLLGEKYGAPVTQREVTEDRQFVGARSVFSSTPTRVMLRYELGEAPTYVPPAYGKFGRAMAAIANEAVEAEIAECPTDAGIKSKIEISYLSNAVATAADVAKRENDAANRAKEKDKL